MYISNTLRSFPKQTLQISYWDNDHWKDYDRQRDPTDIGAHSTSYECVTRDVSQGCQAAEAWNWPLPPCV